MNVPEAVAAIERSPRIFMSNNIVRVSEIPNTGTTADPYDDKDVRIQELGTAQAVLFSLAKLENYSIRGMPDGEVFDLFIARSGGVPTFSGYYCPYVGDKCLFTTLSNNASVMFTAKMDGCTFGIGSQAGNGSVRVGHVNLFSIGSVNRDEGVATARAMQRKAQRKIVRTKLGRNATVIAPDSYLANADAVTTFGFLVDGRTRWLFYTLRYRELGVGELEHCGLHFEGG